ncbi:hypothetical protein BLNAU_6660 [Blattamonas nauphoetae]|uniref:Uncharacterized protein n=1 Tax=Blattamonas nauphoetae TaxID=2049346 RepID=A0ABQ9Y3Q8_9EUKA|nr:hypothetical protein BLNAU_6660 [Blattamonas nauphoetae]
MGNSSYPAYRHRVSNRLFLSLNPDKIHTIKQASRFFLSLVACVKNGSELDDAATQKACALLEWIESRIRFLTSVNPILIDLAPRPDVSCTGFVESLVLLLTCSNEAIVLSTLSFLTKFVPELTSYDSKRFLHSGFFALLPNDFYTNEMHLTPQHDYFLMKIVASILLHMPVGRPVVFYESNQLTGDAFNQILTDKLFRPIQPFLSLVFKHRPRFKDTDASTAFSTLLGMLATYSPIVEQMAQFVLSSSFALTYTDSLIFFETNKITITLLKWVLPTIKKLPKSDPAVRKRNRQILAQLEEEGISDEIELHMQHQAIYPKRFEMRIFEHQILNWQPHEDDRTQIFVTAIRDSSSIRHGVLKYLCGVFLTRQRMTHRRKRKVELPECAEDVLNSLHRYPLLLFLVLISQLSISDCLQERMDSHFKTNLLTTVLLRLIDHLIDTDTLVPICDESEIEEIVSEYENISDKTLPNTLNLPDALLRIVVHLYEIVQHLENEDLVSHTVRLTDPEIDPRSPKFTHFTQLLEPELDELRKQFDPVLYEEAKRITLWRELIEKIVSGEEVENDKSFLKLSFFRPTLLSLQAKCQHLASSSDGSEDTHLDSSLQSISSTTHFKLESLKLVTLLHSLVTSPLPPSLPKQSPDDSFQTILTFYPLNDLDPTERFDSSLFDEEDDEILTKSLIRCFSVCDLVGVDQCIVDLPTFFDRTVSTLGSSNHQVRFAASSLNDRLHKMLSVIYQLPHVWNRLRSAFRDGFPEEQYALIRISTAWINATIVDHSLPPFPFTEFDWDGLFTTDLSDMFTFLVSLRLIMAIRRSSVEDKIERAQANHIILSFERHQQVSSRLDLEFEDFVQENLGDEFVGMLLSYSLLMTLLVQSDFPSSETTFLTTHPEMDVRFLLPIQHNFVLLCHTSLNQHKPKQPPLDLLFERTLRTNPLAFFLPFIDPRIDMAHSLLNTSLCGFHALCRRRVHLDLMDTEYVQTGKHLINSHRMFTSPFISDTFLLFLHFPPPLVVRFFLPFLWLDSSHDFLVDPLRLIMLTLLLFTAPFGDCHSLKELFQSVRHRNNVDHDSSTDVSVTTRCQKLEWLNIPTGFGSALAHSNPRECFDSFEGQVRPHDSSDDSFDSSPFYFRGHLTDIVRLVTDEIYIVASVVPDLRFKNALLDTLENAIYPVCYRAMYSPIPAEVSVLLEFVKRMVSVGSVEFVMEMVRFGMMDIVLRGVSESSFLEDYENGICVIGILLRSICVQTTPLTAAQ